ncbi:MAG: type III secretion system export apparatus subunit SctU [Chlamydiia bacterium]|nr:type III secretion system export apparatus subunit SctU [Chlamydiia bacterium]
MGEKTEKATPKKLRDARKKGQVAKSQDFPAAFTFIASLAITLAMIGGLYERMGGFLIGVFSRVPELADKAQETIPSLYMEAANQILNASIPILILVAFMGVLVNFVVTGPVFSPEVFKPNIKKFNPIDNIKAKFKMKTLFELAKSIFKITGASVLIYLTVQSAFPVLVKTVSMPPVAALLIYSHFLFEVIFKVGLFFIVVAVADLVYQKRNFAKEMMMEKFDVKQEYKNTEGDPQIKGKRRQIAQEIAYSDGPAAGVKKARVVVTNPTHLAIALGYEREKDPAPFIAAMGNGLVAKLIVKEAERFGLPVMRNIGLAHQLWEEGEVWEYVPEHTYEAIAEILRWVAAMESGEEEEQIPIDL